MKLSAKKFLLIILLPFLIVAVLALNHTKKGQTGKNQSVPELAGILSGDQTTRLKSTRQLAERVGPDQALEIVKDSGLPYTGEGHLAVHQIGFVAFEKYGKDAILHCKDYFLSACYHGAIIEAASSQGFNVIKEMTDRCKAFAPRYFQCVHAAGHAINAIWNYDLPNALKTCDQLFETETQYPGTLGSCHNGAFMENLFGVHDWGTGKDHTKYWLSASDPYYPCDVFGPKYQEGCWLNQAARIYQMNNGDLVKTAQICNTAPNSQDVDWCFDNLARQIHPLTESHIEKVTELCGLLAERRDSCIAINAISYYSVGDRSLGVKVCRSLASKDQTTCLEPIINYIASDEISKQEKENLCKEMGEHESSECLSKVQKA